MVYVKNALSTMVPGCIYAPASNVERHFAVIHRRQGMPANITGLPVILLLLLLNPASDGCIVMKITG
jgi:hypothetical protein